MHVKETTIHSAVAPSASPGRRVKVLFLSEIDADSDLSRGGLFEEVMLQLGGNSGNLLFTNAIQRYLEAEGADVIVARAIPSKARDGGYDLCVVNCANWINCRNADLLSTVANQVAATDIPVYFIGLGTQADLNQGPEYVDPIKMEVSSLIRAVLNSGGGFGLRGNFTASVFDRLGFRDKYTVIGCPSVYQRGLAPVDEILPSRKEQFLICGVSSSIQGGAYDALLEAPNCTYICQDTLMKLINAPSQLSSEQLRSVVSISSGMLRCVAEGRARGFVTLSDWVAFLRSGSFSFSTGTRAHGNILARLLGIPVLLHVPDRRVQEIADHYGFPSTTDDPSTWEKIDRVSHDGFNKFLSVLPDRLSEFRAFISLHSLPMKVGEDFLCAPRPRHIAAPSTRNLAAMDALAFRASRNRALRKHAEVLAKCRMTAFAWLGRYIEGSGANRW